MNKTISINIGGFVFNIEEDAYQKLYQYLNSIKKNFTAEDEREEIMNDIESRIAEIFQAKLSSGKEVILDKDVEEMIEIMGRPEDYVSDEFTQQADSGSKTKDQSTYRNTNEKRLFRDTENATLGGVCAGLAHYTNIDVTIIRIIFVVLSIVGGSGLLIYLILLFVVPEAKSTSDRMQMKGQAINIESIKEHFQKIKNDITENTKNGKFRRTFNDTVDRGVKVGSSAARAFSKFFGIACIIGGSFALILLFAVLFSDSGLLPLVGTEHSENLGAMLDILYPGSVQSSIVFFAILVVTLIPILSIITTGTKILFSIKQSFKSIAIVSSILWFMAIGVLIITGINLGMSMRNESTVDYDIPFTDSTNTLFIDVAKDDIFSDHLAFEDVWNTTELIRITEKNIVLGYPELVLTEKKDSGNFEIILHKQSNGLSNKDAISKAERISYPITLTGNQLLMPAYFTFPKEDKLRAQQIKVEVQIPFGKKVILGNNIDRIDMDFNTGNRYEEESFSNTTWTTSGNHLFCSECKEVRFIYNH